MKFSIQWIKDYVSVDLTPDQLSHRLTMGGLEVEHIEKKSDDYIFELEVTPNRPDALSMIGLAREIAAMTSQSMDLPKVSQLKQSVSKNIKIGIEAKDVCSKYLGVIIDDITISPTPQWMKTRLQSLNSRPINNIVDITNFCLFESGQPMHAFDYDKLAGGQIIVRYAKKGETIVTLDDVKRELDGSMLIIADAEKPIAIAGIMGGRDTQVTVDTKRILLECAHFCPVAIRRMGRKLALSTDSSYRFERGVDHQQMETSALRAVQLFQQMATGQVTHYRLVSGKKIGRSVRITMKLQQLYDHLGSQIKPAKIKRILKSLDCQVTMTKDELTIIPPSFRQDLTAPVDLIEEVARIIGYDALPESLPTVSLNNILDNPKVHFRQGIRQLLAGLGLSEVVSYSLLSLKEAEHVAELRDIVSVTNPLSSEQAVLRPSMVPSFLKIIQNNINRGQKDLAIFEITKKYSVKGEQECVIIALTGQHPADWQSSMIMGRPYSFFDLKGVVKSLVERFAIKNIHWQTETKQTIYNKDEGAFSQLMAGASILGCAGLLSDRLTQKFGVKQPVFFVELDLEKLFKHKTDVKLFRSFSDFPAITRDVSLAVPEVVSFEQLQTVALELGGDLLQSVQFVELYLGDKIPNQHRGLMFSLKYQVPDRTLTDTEVQECHDQIIQRWIQAFSVIQR